MIRETTGRRSATIAVFVLYVGLTAVAVLRHEPWRDEADVWLTVRDSGVGEIAERARYSGTPTLWYVVVLPLAKLGLPYCSMGVLHLLVACAAVAIFLWRAPFSLLTRTLFVFSYYMFYEYAVIARPYALSILLLFCIAALWRRRGELPLTIALLLALLFQTHGYALMIGGVLAIVFAGELVLKSPRSPVIWAAIAVLIAAAMSTIFQLYPAADGHLPTSFFTPLQPVAIRWALAGMLLPAIPIFTVAPIGGLLLLLVAMSLWPRKRLLLLFVGMSGAILYVLVFKHVLKDGYRHFGLLLIVSVFALWLDRTESEGMAVPNTRIRAVTTGFLNLCLALSTIAGFWSWYCDFRYSFSGAEEMAGHLRTLTGNDQVIIAHQAAPASALLPYLPGRQFWYAGTEQFGTYMSWRRDFAEGDRIGIGEVLRRAQKRFGASGDWLLLINSEFPEPQRDGLRLVASNRRQVFAKHDEVFFLYRRIRS